MPVIKDPRKRLLPQGITDLVDSILGPGGLQTTPAIAVDPKRIGAIKRAGAQVLGEDVRTLPTLSGTPPSLVSALTQLQSKYPRIFGHLEGIDIEPTKRLTTSNGTKALGTHSRGFHPSGKTSVMRLAGKLGDKDLKETAGHELAHAAQQIKHGGRFQGKYWLMDLKHGYWNNPFEIGARRAGKNFNSRLNFPKMNESIPQQDLFPGQVLGLSSPLEAQLMNRVK